jgi:iron complex outermembrane receptor protein
MILFHEKKVAVRALLIFAMAGFQPAFNCVAHAAEDPADDDKLGEIVVTAQKRTENLQKVPIAATVLGSEILRQKGFVQLSDLAPLVPGLNIFSGQSYGFPQFTLRGVGSGSYNQNANSVVGVYLDEFVLDSPTSQQGQFFDLQRIEVLNGPQGTLFGKNTTGGALNFITRKPDGTTAADLAVTVGRWGELDLSGGAQTAITDRLSIRVAGNRNYSDGYGYNSYLGKRVDKTDNWGARVGVAYQSDDVDAYLKLYADDMNAAQQYSVNIGQDPATGLITPDNSNPVTGYIYPTEKDVYGGNGYSIDTRNRGATLNVNYHVGDYTISSVTGYVVSKSHVTADYDESPFRLSDSLDNSLTSRQFSQEIRLSSSDEGNFSWIVGGNFFHKRFLLHNLTDLSDAFGVPPIGETDRERTTSFAGFVDGTLKLGSGFSVTGGIRLTHDQKSMFFLGPDFQLIGPFDVKSKKGWTEPTYRAILNYQLDPDTMLYASYSHGYRSGAYDVGLKSSPYQLTPVNPEFVDNYEVGAKGTLFDNRLRLSTAFYYMRFKDQQLSTLATEPGSLCCNLLNAGQSRVYGAELQITARPTPNLTFSLLATVSDGKFKEFYNGPLSYAGQKLPYLPDFKVRFSPEYRIPHGNGGFFIAPDITVTGKARNNVTPNIHGYDIQKTFAMIDAQAGYRADMWSIFGWVKNATDYRNLTNYGPAEFAGFSGLYYGPPRSYGLTATVRY